MTDLRLTILICLLLISPYKVYAQVSLPPINLGATSFLDGMGGPGTLLEETLNYYSANDVMDAQGNKIFSGSDIDTITATTLIAHLTPHKVWGGFYGFEVLIPVVDLDIEVVERNKKSGTGDLIFSPFILQWVGHKIGGMPYNHRLNLSFSLPTGSYSSDNPLNIGSNAFSFNPYYAFTIQPTSRVETSVRLYYLWNEKNRSPNTPDNIKNTQAGDAFHMNYAVSYKLSKSFRLGLAGYYLKQLSNHKINDQAVADSKETVFAIGPGFNYNNNNFRVVFNTYFESNVENRAEGTRFILKASKVF